MIREIPVHQISRNICQMCIEANISLSSDMQKGLARAGKEEISPLGKKVLEQLEENLEIAGQEQIPICQDTGMAVVFLEVGQDVHLIDGDLREAVNEGVRRGYREGYLRKSVVRDPILRENTGIIRRRPLCKAGPGRSD